MIKKLLNLADKLDQMGLVTEADSIDKIIKKSMDEYSDEDTEIIDLPVSETVPQERINKLDLTTEHRRKFHEFFPGYEGDEDLTKVKAIDIMFPDAEGAHPAAKFFRGDLRVEESDEEV